MWCFLRRAAIEVDIPALLLSGAGGENNSLSRTKEEGYNCNSQRFRESSEAYSKHMELVDLPIELLSVPFVKEGSGCSSMG